MTVGLPDLLALCVKAKIDLNIPALFLMARWDKFPRMSVGMSRRIRRQAFGYTSSRVV
jgi:hypothetical protein